MNEPTLPGIDEETNPRAVIGANMPPAEPPYDPAVLAVLDARAAKFVEVSEMWNTTEVTNEALEGQITDQIAGLRKVATEIETARKAAKKVHDDRGKAVQTAFTPLSDLIDKSLKACLKQLDKWIAKKKADAEAERRRLARIAAEAEQQARLAAMDAARSGSIADQAAAEKALDVAAVAQKVAAAAPTKVAAYSGSGGGRTISQRTRRACSITNITHAFMSMRDKPEVAELLVTLANREANAAGFRDDQTIPGFSIEKITTLA